MKKTLLLIPMLSMLASCYETDPPNGPNLQKKMIHSFILTYKDTPLAASTQMTDWEGHGVKQAQITLRGWPGGVSYQAPETGGKGEKAATFLQIAERNGDRRYDREVYFDAYRDNIALSDNYREIRVVCTNAAWDDAHPEGASLSDVALCITTSAAEYIRSGYTVGEGWKKIRKRPAEMTEEDLSMLKYHPVIRFDSHPAAGKYDMEVTLVTTEGEEQVSTCTFDFDEPKTAV